MKNRVYTEEERARILAQIEGARKSGTSMHTACEKAGIHWSLYYTWRRKAQPAKAHHSHGPKPITKPRATVRRRKTPKVELLTIPTAPQSLGGSLFFVMGKPAEIRDLIRSLS